MQITWGIECETIGELIAHLHEMKLQVIGKRKREGLKDDDQFLNAEGLNDNNCYGVHEVTGFKLDAK